MIKMLSRFDLKPGIDIALFAEHYYSFVERAIDMDLAVSSDRIGRRVNDTPMDTDADDAQQYYVLMHFRDREQLDRAYEYMDSDTAEPQDLKPHSLVKKYVKNPVFTCWQEPASTELI